MMTIPSKDSPSYLRSGIVHTCDSHDTLNNDKKLPMKNIHFIFCLSLVVFLSSCKKEDEQEQEYALLNLEIDCIENNVNIVDFSEWFAIKHVVLLAGDDVLFCNDESLYFYDNSDRSVNLIAEDIDVNGISVKDNTAFICSNVGVHRFGSSTSYVLNEVSNLRCYDIDIKSDGELLFSHITSSYIGHLFKISEGNIVEPFSNDLHASKLETLDNGEVWYIDNRGIDKTITRLDSNGDVIAVFNSNAELIDGEEILDNIWFAEGNNELFLVSKSGFGVAKINKYSFDTQTWSTLLTDSLLNGDMCISDDKYFDIRVPSYTDVVFLNGDLYISTTLASCRGFHKINVTGNTPIQCEDIDMVRAENILGGACFDGIYINKETNRILIHSQRMVYIGDICE